MTELMWAPTDFKEVPHNSTLLHGGHLLLTLELLCDEEVGGFRRWTDPPLQQRLSFRPWETLRLEFG